MPVIVMNSDQTKNRQRAEIPHRSDLADDLRTWLQTLQNEGGSSTFAHYGTRSEHC